MALYETRKAEQTDDTQGKHTDKLDLKQVANDFVSGDQHRCAFLDHLLPQNGWVWLGGCGFGLTTLKELAPGLDPNRFVRKHQKDGSICRSEFT